MTTNRSRRASARFALLPLRARRELVVDGTIDPTWGVHDVKLQSWAVGRVGRRLIQSGICEIALR